MIAALAFMTLLLVAAGVARLIDRGPIAGLISALLGDSSNHPRKKDS